MLANKLENRVYRGYYRVRKRFLLIAMLLIVAVAGLWYIGADTGPVKKGPKAVAENGVIVGKRVAGFTLPDLEGKQITVGQSGKITVINFWATWCPPCREEMPELNQFARKYHQSLLFYAVNIQEPSSTVSEFLKQNNYTMPTLLDSDGTVAKHFRISAIPTTIVIDEEGLITYRKSGAMTMSELEEVLKGL